MITGRPEEKAGGAWSWLIASVTPTHYIGCRVCVTAYECSILSYIELLLTILHYPQYHPPCLPRQHYSSISQSSQAVHAVKPGTGTQVSMYCRGACADTYSTSSPPWTAVIVCVQSKHYLFHEEFPIDKSISCTCTTTLLILLIVYIVVSYQYSSIIASARSAHLKPPAKSDVRSCPDVRSCLQGTINNTIIVFEGSEMIQYE